MKNYSSILIFTGDGSKILDKNSIYLKDEYKFFNDMTFFEENTDLICGAAYLFHTSEKSLIKRDYMMVFLFSGLLIIRLVTIMKNVFFKKSSDQLDI